MSTTLQPEAPIQSETERIQTSLKDAKASNTWKAYRQDLGHAKAWLLKTNQPNNDLPMSPKQVCLWLLDQEAEGAALASIARRYACLSKLHQMKGIPEETNPCKKQVSRETLEAIKRRYADTGKSCASLAEPFTLKQIQRAVIACNPQKAAMIAVTFLSAARRSELAAIQMNQIKIEPKGVRILIAKGKTDQKGKGRWVFLPDSGNGLEVSNRVKAWLAMRGDGAGSFFCASDRAFSRLAKEVARLNGLDPARYSAHSFRAGFVTEAARSKATVHEIMSQTGHQSSRTVDMYVRMAVGFDESPAGRLVATQ